MPKITLWGFNGSTYVRTVRMLLAEKGVSDYTQVPINVLAGEPKSPDHLRRHPFGKVPVVDVDDFRLIETPAIIRFLDALLPGPALVPADLYAVARMDMAISLIDSYGYGAMIGGVAAYHLFPDFVGGKDGVAHRKGIETGKLVMTTLMDRKGQGPFLAGPDLSLADLYVAPVFAYVTLTPHKEEFLALPGVAAWWDRVTALNSFRVTEA